MTFKLNIPGRDGLPSGEPAKAANAANLRIEGEQIRGFAEIAANEAAKPSEPVPPIRGFAEIAAPDANNAESMRERSALISADGARPWKADALAGLVPWTDREIDLFVKRQARIAWLGYGGASEYLAEKLVNRDRDRDDRRLCVECSHGRPGNRCGKNAGFMLHQLQRCDQFVNMSEQREEETP